MSDQQRNERPLHEFNEATTRMHAGLRAVIERHWPEIRRAWQPLLDWAATPESRAVLAAAEADCGSRACRNSWASLSRCTVRL